MKTVFGLPILNGKIDIKACKPKLRNNTLTFYENNNGLFIIIVTILTIFFLKADKLQFKWIYIVYFLAIILLSILYKYYGKILKWKITEKGFIIRYSPLNSLKKEQEKEHLIEWNEINKIYLTDIFQPHFKDKIKLASTKKTYSGIIIEFREKHKTIKETFFQSD